MQSLVTLGRQPALSLAELESLYGADAVMPCGPKAAIIDREPQAVDFLRLGGAIKLCQLLTQLETSDWQSVERYLIDQSEMLNGIVGPGKLHLGISAQGFDITIQKLESTGLTVKKALKNVGRSVRLVPNKTLELSSAQVFHNHLVGERGLELVIVKTDSGTVIGRTVAVQNITSYTERDRDRPKRDAKVGMLPPKLAQIIINLALTAPSPGIQHILDPFCGTGVLLQEALLLGYPVVGTDIEQRMIDYSKQNLEWLAGRYTIKSDYELQQADATSFHWGGAISAVASETYLGRPFTAMPSPEILNQTASGCNLIIRKFLQNIAPQIAAGTRLCIAIPAWNLRPEQSSYKDDEELSSPLSAKEQHYGRQPHSESYTRANRTVSRPGQRPSFRFLPLVDQIEELGYNRVSFEHVKDEDLLYFRPDQIVARQLIILIRS